MGQRDADDRWRDFVTRAIDRFGEYVEAVELGSTVNRFKWSGYTIGGYLRAVRIGAAVCQARGVRWFAPNVSDFSPIYNIAILQRLASSGLVPAAHTNNLFVDRANQPENHDERVPIPVRSLKPFDLTGKARFLAAISRRYGIPRTISTYSYWTLDVKSDTKLRYASEDRYAEYLVRYLVLAAASGQLDQVYWGQMISYSKGLIDDGTGISPVIPNPHHTWKIHGDPGDYVIRPGFSCFRQVIAALKDTNFKGRLDTSGGTFAFDFESKSGGGGGETKRLVIAWTRDSMSDSLEERFAAAGTTISRIRTLHGEPVSTDDLSLCSAPRFIEYEGPPVSAERFKDNSSPLESLLVPDGNGFTYAFFRNSRFAGIISNDFRQASGDATEDPRRLLETDKLRLVKDSPRNYVAELTLHDDSREWNVFFKEARTVKRTSRRSLSRAGLTWANTCEVLRRGIDTPQPLAILERNSRSSGLTSFLLVEKAEGAIPLRKILDRVRDGRELPIPMKAEEFLGELGRYVRKIHRRGINHRDLTGGNILVSHDGVSPRPHFLLIDLSRARFHRKLSNRQRTRDLSRIRLGGRHRRIVLEAYLSSQKGLGRTFGFLAGCSYHLHRAIYNIKKPSRMIRLVRKLFGGSRSARHAT